MYRTKDRLERNIHVRVSSGLRAQLERLAERANEDLSDLVRRGLQKFANEEEQSALRRMEGSTPVKSSSGLLDKIRRDFQEKKERVKTDTDLWRELSQDSKSVERPDYRAVQQRMNAETRKNKTIWGD